MANVGPVRIFTSLRGIDTFADLRRFVSSFTQEMGQQFNNLLSNRMVSGAVGATGVILAGSNFGVSFPVASTYLVSFTTPYSQRPVVTVTPENNATAFAAGVTTTGFTVITSANTPFSFIARGEN